MEFKILQSLDCEEHYVSKSLYFGSRHQKVVSILGKKMIIWNKGNCKVFEEFDHSFTNGQSIHEIIKWDEASFLVGGDSFPICLVSILPPFKVLKSSLKSESSSVLRRLNDDVFLYLTTINHLYTYSFHEKKSTRITQRNVYGYFVDSKKFKNAFYDVLDRHTGHPEGGKVVLGLYNEKNFEILKSVPFCFEKWFGDYQMLSCFEDPHGEEIVVLGGEFMGVHVRFVKFSESKLEVVKEIKVESRHEIYGSFFLGGFICFCGSLADNIVPPNESLRVLGLTEKYEKCTKNFRKCQPQQAATHIEPVSVKDFEVELILSYEGVVNVVKISKFPVKLPKIPEFHELEDEDMKERVDWLKRGDVDFSYGKELEEKIFCKIKLLGNDSFANLKFLRILFL